jgi:hypothetical protein
MATAAYAGGFLVKTPHSDRVLEQIYADHKLREQQKFSDSKMLDEEYSKNISNVWDADIPEITKSYSDYKQAWHV